MPQSEFVMRIVHIPSGKCVDMAPGLAAEMDLLNDLCARVRAKGVGLGCSEDHVVEDVRAAFREALMALKGIV